MPNKLVMCGCSFSGQGEYAPLNDKPEAKIPYGVVAARECGLGYLHLARPGGSNTRIWRVLVNAILNGEVQPQNVVGIQYTEVVRMECWTQHPSVIAPEDYAGGRMMTLKSQVHMALDQGEPDYEFTRLWGTEHLCTPYSVDMWRVQHTMLTALLEQRGFNKVFFIRNRYNEWYLKGINEDRVIDLTDISSKEGNWEDGPGIHLTEQGHKIVGKMVADKINLYI